MDCKGLLLLLGVSVLIVWGVFTRVREKIQPGPVFTSIYFINLDRRPKKRKRLETDLVPLKKLAGDIIRFGAVDGEALSPSSIDSRIIGARGADDLTRTDKTFGLSLTKGAIGCALSHKKIWEEVVGAKKERVLILEDDAVILPDFVDTIPKIIGELPKKWDILYLGSGQYTIDKRISPHLARPSRIYGLFGYVINWRGARRLLKHGFPLRYQLDTQLWLNFGKVKPLVAVPLVVGEKKGPSDVQIH